MYGIEFLLHSLDVFVCLKDSPFQNSEAKHSLRQKAANMRRHDPKEAE